jgi:hypothetical protein
MATDYNGRNIWGPTDGAPVTTYKVDSDRRDIDIANDIARLMPEATPFITILMRARKVPVDSQEFIWYDRGKQEWWTELTSSYSSGTAHTELTLDLDDTSFLRKKDILMNAATGEMFRVKSVDSSSQVTVERGYGYDSDASSGTDAVASEGTDDNIMRVSNAMEENSNAPDTYATQPTKLWNLVQTFRTPFDASMANQLEAKKAGQNPRVELRREKLIEHRIDIEKQCMFGERYEDLSNNIRMTGGLIQFIESNSYDVDSTNGGILTEAEWENFCEMAFDWGSDTKLFLTSPKVGSIINQFAAGRIETTSEQDTYGMRLRRYISFHGDVLIATTKLFEKDYASTGLMLDIENIDFRPFGGMDSKLRANIQDPDLMGWKDEYATMAGLRVRLEKTHSILTGVAA